MTREELYEQICASGAWRPLPQTMQRVIAVVDDPEHSDADGLAFAIEQDKDLSAMVLKHMNSAFFAPPRPVECVTDAVVMLGFESLRTLMVYHLTSYLLPDQTRARKQFSVAEYWRHSLATSISADLLGQRVGFADTFRLFTYGLLHDIGFILLDACLSHLLDEIYEKIVVEKVPQLVAEKAVLGGATHAELGAWLCRSWHLDSEAQYITEYHHTPEQAPAQSRELLLIYIGNIIGTGVYENNMAIRLGRSPVDERVLEKLGLTVADVEEVEVQMPEELARFQERNTVY